MISFPLIALGVFYLIGFLVSLTALEMYEKPTFKDLIYHLGISLVWPVILIIGLYQAYKIEK